MNLKIKQMLIMALMTGLLTAAAKTEEEQPMEPDQISQIIQTTAEKIRERYVFPELGERIADALLEGYSKGDYREMEPSRLVMAVSEHLYELSGDKHLRLYWTDSTGKSRKHRKQKTPEETNFGISRIELLEGNVRYLDLRGFHELSIAKPKVEATMELINTGSAIIIDLRSNGGGYPETVNLVFSYFMEPEIEYITFFDRNGKKQRTFSTRVELQGERLLSVPVFVLTSKKTFSGGEELAYNFKTFKRGLLIGETTGGGANPGNIYKLSSGFAIFVPEERPLNPITNANWEGVGVIPDVVVPADQALDKALELIDKQVGPNPSDS